MDSQTVTPIIRHRIQEITIQPTTSKRETELEVFVDGQCVHRLSKIIPGQKLRWDMQTYPCDVRLESVIGVKLIEKYKLSPDLEVLAEYTILDTTNQTSIARHLGAFPSRLSGLGLSSKRQNTATSVGSLMLTVKFLDLSQIAGNYPATFVRATKMVEETSGPLDRLGNSREVLKTILGFGEVVAELHPIAKLVIGLCTAAWERLEKIQEQYEGVQRLIGGLTQMQPFINSVKDHAKEATLEHVILSLLRLVEDTSCYIINSMHQTSTGRITHGLNATRESYRINELLQKFGELKEQFDRGVSVQVLNQVLSIEQRALINRLESTAPSLGSASSPCQEGTRVQAMSDICAWQGDTANPKKLLWLYGQAGMGKSSIAASLCQVFHDAGTLGAHFFFRRDDPYLRSPEHMLNIIVHRLAFRYEPYGRAVASAIENYSGLLDMPLGQRYVHLVERPLRNLILSPKSPPRSFVIVVDALDECEHTNSRRPLFTYLREMSQLAPWIKILVTSRPDEDIEIAFDSASYSYVSSRNVANYDASSDILKYTQTRMTDMVNRKKQPRWSEDSIRELSSRAAGLFIWVETACKFIERGGDMKLRLEQVLAGTQSAEGSAPLDLLYTTAIRQGMGDEGPDNVRVFRECIGAIVTTGGRTPLSVAGLESLLSGHVSPGVFRTVVTALGSVMYEDAGQLGAVRVYHPSFADFILDPSRSGRFYTDLNHQNAVLADYSLRTMMRELRFNICGLETSHIPNCDVVDLKTRVQTAIGPHLAYSCLHWSSHLIQTLNGTFQDQLDIFLYGQKLLYWIEAMSLLGQTSAALSSLLELVNCVTHSTEDYLSYVNDAYRFILTFYDAIAQSTPHLYISALPFAPTRSMLAQRMRPFFPNMFMTAPSTNEGWPTWLQSIPHNGEVISVACSANGRRIVSGCRDGTVRIWDSETGAALSDPLDSPDVCRVAISSNEQRIASASVFGMLRVWDAGTGVALADRSGEHLENVLCLTLSSDGNKLFAVNGSGSMLVWDINTKTQEFKQRLDHLYSINSAAVSPDEQLVASCYVHGVVKTRDIKTDTPLNKFYLGHSGLISCVAFSPSGRIIAIGSDDSTVRIWDVRTGRALCQPMCGHSRTVLSVAFSPNGRHVVSGSMDRTVRVWDVETGMPACSPLIGHTRRIYSVAFCSNSQRAVSASADNTVLAWDVATDATMSKSPAGHTHDVNSVAFSSDGFYIASGSADGTVRVWDAQTGDEAFTSLDSQAGAVDFVAFIPNSRDILILAGNQTVMIQNVESGAQVASFNLSSSDDVLSLALSPDGRHIASGSKDGRVGVWDIETRGTVFAPVAAHSDWVSAVTFSPDRHYIASGSEDGTVQIWEAETGAAVGEPSIGRSSNVSSLRFSPDSRRIASGYDDGTVQVWNIESSAVMFVLRGGHLEWISSIAFTPNGRYLISGSGDATVRIWDAETGAAVAEPLKGHSNAITSIALSPDGRRIATGSFDSTVRVWDTDNLYTHNQLVVEELFTAPLKRSISTSVLAHHVNKSGWVTSSSGKLLLWLPKQRQRVDDSLTQIGIPPAPDHVLLDFSRFVHGDSWASVTRE